MNLKLSYNKIAERLRALNGVNIKGFKPARAVVRNIAILEAASEEFQKIIESDKGDVVGKALELAEDKRTPAEQDAVLEWVKRSNKSAEETVEIKVYTVKEKHIEKGIESKDLAPIEFFVEWEDEEDEEEKDKAAE